MLDSKAHVAYVYKNIEKYVYLLIGSTFVTAPAFGTVDFVRHAQRSRGGSQSMFRAVHPEAEIILDNTTFRVGGLQQTSKFLAYCNRTEFALTADPLAWRFHNYSIPLAFA